MTAADRAAHRLARQRVRQALAEGRAIVTGMDSTKGRVAILTRPDTSLETVIARRDVERVGRALLALAESWRARR